MKSRIALLLLLMLASTHMASAQTRMPAAVTAYLDELAHVEQASSAVSMEPLFKAASDAQDALIRFSANDLTWMEALTDTEYSALEKTMRGFHLSRGMDIYAQPDSTFLLALAQTHGLPQDQAFFTLYQQYWTADQLPRYLAQGKGQTLCVRFDQGIVPELYQSWGEYAAKYPKAYADFTQQTLSDLEEAVALGVCTCSNQRSVENELSGFLQRFPKTASADQIRARLQELKTDPGLRPVICR